MRKQHLHEETAVGDLYTRCGCSPDGTSNTVQVRDVIAVDDHVHVQHPECPALALPRRSRAGTRPPPVPRPRPSAVKPTSIHRLLPVTSMLLLPTSWNPSTIFTSPIPHPCSSSPFSDLLSDHDLSLLLAEPSFSSLTPRPRQGLLQISTNTI